MKKRVRVLIKGRVQGVFFRAYMKDAATKEGVVGWVRNNPDGTVEAVFEGDANKVDRMIEWCKKGSPLSRVDKVTVSEELVQEDFTEFVILR